MEHIVENTEKRPYPEPKVRELSEPEKAGIRGRIEAGEKNSQKLADEFNCSRSQVAGVLATMAKK